MLNYNKYSNFDKKIIDQWLWKCDDINKFNKTLSNLIKEGWQPRGNIKDEINAYALGGHTYSIELVKYEKK